MDKETAVIVHKVLQMKADELGNYQIANRLAADKVKTPSIYEFGRTEKIRKGYDPKYPWDWSAQTIDKMLRNQIYLGHMVSCTQTTKSFKN